MTEPGYETDRFTSESGVRIIVQVPEPQAQDILDAVTAECALAYGDYDRVSFRTAAGTQQFRSSGAGRNVATLTVVEVPCVELSFFLPGSGSTVVDVLGVIYARHPYEEPVIFVQSCIRTLHIRGMDEDNPNRFWNRARQDWVPGEHR